MPQPVYLQLRWITHYVFLFNSLFPRVTAGLSSAEVQEGAFSELWKRLLLDLTATINRVRRAVNVKVELNSSRKLVVGLETLEERLGIQFQSLIDTLQNQVRSKEVVAKCMCECG